MVLAMPSFPASLPGMWDRTITVGSAGKTFSVTGWKVRSVDNRKMMTSLLTTSC